MVECLINFLEENLNYTKLVAPLNREIAINFMERQVGAIMFCFCWARQMNDKQLTNNITIISEEYNNKMKEAIFNED